MSPHYERHGNNFQLLSSPVAPAWRQAQIGAIGALVAHWAVHDHLPALVAIPTGSGKTAIATALPYVLRAERVLVVAPSRQLRGQLAESFLEESVLHRIGALTKSTGQPKVIEVEGRTIDWEALRDADVVVALPNSISPAHHQEAPPPVDLFDLVIVDEAHHAPAPTWRAILDHWQAARKVLLSATPRRRDGKRVPGDLVFHYPLKRAIDEGSYKAVEPEILPVSATSSRADCDQAIVDRIKMLKANPIHRTSTLLIRAESRTRAYELARLYDGSGVHAEVLTSKLSPSEQTRIADGLIDGSINSVVVVGMLGEGFDLPSLRLAAYHDKHKSVNSTIQLIGRLVRANDRFPQPSVIVTVGDADVYPALRGVVRALWEEDAEWSRLLPSIADKEIEEAIADQRFADELDAAPPELALEAIQPMVSVTVYESVDEAWEPMFAGGKVPDGILTGRIIRGREIFYSSVTPDGQTLIVVMRRIVSPRWNADSGLDSAGYELYLLTWIPPRSSDRAGLLLLNEEDGQVGRALLLEIGAAPGDLRTADPTRLQDGFDAIPRNSVSNVGVRNTYIGGRGAPTYKMFAGSSVDRGLREADTAQAAIGHAMAQVATEGAAYTTGIATERGKFWEARYVPLRLYQELLNGFADRYWLSVQSENRLLPDVARGSRIGAFPQSDVVTIEMDPNLVGFGWVAAGGIPIEVIELQPIGSRSVNKLEIQARDLRSEKILWFGYMDIEGRFHTDSTSPLCYLRRGYGSQIEVADLLSMHPPSIYFYDGTTLHGRLRFNPVGRRTTLPEVGVEVLEWDDVNICAELDRTAAREDKGISVQAAVVRHLRETQGRYARRWILGNDGPGEIADFIVLEVDYSRQVRLSLWHVKPSDTPVPAVRVKDMQVVVAQAIKSRRWLTDLAVWDELGRRLDGEASPRLTVIEGSERLLRVLLGRTAHKTWALDQRTRLMRGDVVIAQPGLSWVKLKSQLSSGTLSAQQVRDLLAVFDDAVGQRGATRVVCSE